MVNIGNAIRRMERLYNKLNQLRNEADKEAYYYRKDTDVNQKFNDFSDTINTAVSSARNSIRDLQAMYGYATTCPCMAKKTTKTTKKPTTRKVARR